MSAYGSVIPLASRLAGKGPELSKKAKQRLKWMDHYERHGNASLTCRYFGIAPKTFWKWRKRYNRKNLHTLEDRSTRPRRVRGRTWKPRLIALVRALRERYPRWGKDKLVVLVRRRGFAISTSTVGRILSLLRRLGLLREPVRGGKRFKQRSQQPRPYAVRKPRDYRVEAPGDLLQLDTQEQHPLPGVTLRHFAARDCVSRWDVLSVHSRATASLARDFLVQVEERMPFAVRALQIDGGSEFKAEFEEACRERGLLLFVLPPKSPKLNGKVERSHRTHEEEFYQCYEGELTVQALQPELRAWEHTYNHVRPHQALGYRTPAQWLRKWQREQRRGNENEPA